MQHFTEITCWGFRMYRHQGQVHPILATCVLYFILFPLVFSQRHCWSICWALFEDPATTALSEEGYQMILQFHDTDKALGMAHHVAVALCVWPRYVSRGSRLYSARSRGPEDEGACPQLLMKIWKGLDSRNIFNFFVHPIIDTMVWHSSKKAVFNKSGIDWMNWGNDAKCVSARRCRLPTSQLWRTSPWSLQPTLKIWRTSGIVMQRLQLSSGVQNLGYSVPTNDLKLLFSWNMIWHDNQP